MAVYTEVSDQALNDFLSAYDLGLLLSFKGIAEGVENSNFLLHTDRGHFILTLYEKRVAESDLPFFLNLLGHLSGKGVNCPQPVVDRNGRALGRLAGRPAAIGTFLEGVSIGQPKAKHCLALGEALAKLHADGADFPMRRANTLSLESWPKLFAQAEARADSVVPGLADETHAELEFLGRCWPAGLPGGIIHADLFPDNVFFIGDALSGLIDFYFACTDAFAYDLSVCLNAWCFTPEHVFDPSLGRALTSGYDRVRRLSHDERAALPVLARGSALRFMLTRLVDWLDVPQGALVKPKDPREYLRKLRFHRTVDNARAYGLGD